MPHIWFDALRCKIKGISSKSIGIIYNILIKLYGMKKKIEKKILKNLVVSNILLTFALRNVRDNLNI